MNAFQAVGVHIHQLVRFEERFYLRPYASEQRVVFSPPQIPKTEMNNPRRWIMQDDAFREIRILGNDDKFVLSGELPNLRICWTGSESAASNYGKARCELNSRRNVLIEEKAPHSNRHTFISGERRPCKRSPERQQRQPRTCFELREGMFSSKRNPSCRLNHRIMISHQLRCVIKTSLHVLAL